MNTTIEMMLNNLEHKAKVAKENLRLFKEAHLFGTHWVDVNDALPILEIGTAYLIRRSYGGRENPGDPVLAIWEKNGWRDIVGMLRSTHAAKSSIEVWS